MIDTDVVVDVLAAAATTPLGGSTWRYDYIVANDGSITAEIALFDILFDPELYAEASLVIASEPAVASAWDQQILASGIGVPAAFDALALAEGIGIGQNASGFAVSFTWLGEGTPGEQPVEIYDAGSFALLGTTMTTPVPAPAVEPVPPEAEPPAVPAELPAVGPWPGTPVPCGPGEPEPVLPADGELDPG